MDDRERNISSSSFESGYAENVHGSQIGTQINYPNLKHLIKQPAGIVLAIFLILFLSGTTFVIGKASVNQNNCVFTTNCRQKIDSDLKNNHSEPERNLNIHKDVEQIPDVNKDHSLEAAMSVGTVALAFWLFILFLV